MKRHITKMKICGDFSIFLLAFVNELRLTRKKKINNKMDIFEGITQLN